MKIIQGKEIKGYSYADGVNWYWGDKEVAVINELRREIEWCDRTFNFPQEVVDDIRNRIPGDKLKLLNRPTKKLKVLMQEKRVSFLERSRMVVMSDDLGPFWVSTFGLDIRVLVDNSTERVLLIFGY